MRNGFNMGTSSGAIPDMSPAASESRTFDSPNSDLYRLTRFSYLHNAQGRPEKLSSRITMTCTSGDEIE